MGQLWSALVSLFSLKKLDICIVGLEASGKTTLLQVLAQGNHVDTLPTIGLNVKHLKRDGVYIKCWDLGGQKRFRSEWPKYTSNCDAILFVVDGNDFEKIPQAKEELKKLLELPDLKGKPILIVLNKIDKTPCVSKDELVNHLNLKLFTDNEWAVIPISALKMTHVVEVINWLVRQAK